MSDRNKITIDVNCKVNVDKDTAEFCLKLVEIFLNDNKEYFVADGAPNDKDGAIKFVLQKR